MDSKMYQVTVFCDLSKAFDTISQEILLHELSVLGIRGPAYKWFESYLGSRRQYTKYKNAKSSSLYVKSGVPQGSILGPILFLIYINDIVCISNKLQFILYADDTTVIYQSRSLSDLLYIMNTELIHLSNWLKSNRLSLNIAKTNFMISVLLMTQPPTANIRMNGISLKQVNDVKFLGVVIDSKLKWKSHIEDVTAKLAKLRGVLFKLRNCMSVECMKQLYLSLVYPHLLHSSNSLG